MHKQLRKIVQQILMEEKRVNLPSGKSVVYASQAHINYLEDLYKRLCHERSNYKRGSSTRADFSAACRRTKRKLDVALAHAERLNKK